MALANSLHVPDIVKKAYDICFLSFPSSFAFYSNFTVYVFCEGVTSRAKINALTLEPPKVSFDTFRIPFFSYLAYSIAFTAKIS